VLRVAAEHGYESIGDEADDEDDFTEGEPELGFAIPFDGK